MKKIISFCLLVVLSAETAYAASVYEKEGNIFYADNGKAAQLTSLGRDGGPVLHPGDEWVYFVRNTPGKWKEEKYYPAKGEVVKNGVLKDELWRINTDGSQARLLFRNEISSVDGPDPNYTIAAVGNIQFSPDGKKVYFETSRWVTSAALYVMNEDGSGVTMLGDGNGTKIILSANTFEGREKSYRGYIVTAQHRYFFYGGSYDWFYLYSPDMKKYIAPLGDDFDFFTETGDIIYTDHSEKKIKRSEKLKNL